jgi:hypothetical protein
VKTLGRRVQCLEERQGVGCATCRGWDSTVIEDSFGGRSQPDHCPACGRIVPPHLVIRLEGVRWDAIWEALMTPRSLTTRIDCLQAHRPTVT